MYRSSGNTHWRSEQRVASQQFSSSRSWALRPTHTTITAGAPGGSSGISVTAQRIKSLWPDSLYDWANKQDFDLHSRTDQLDTQIARLESIDPSSLPIVARVRWYDTLAYGHLLGSRFQLELHNPNGEQEARAKKALEVSRSGRALIGRLTLELDSMEIANEKKTDIRDWITDPELQDSLAFVEASSLALSGDQVGSAAALSDIRCSFLCQKPFQIRFFPKVGTSSTGPCKC